MASNMELEDTVATDLQDTDLMEPRDTAVVEPDEKVEDEEEQQQQKDDDYDDDDDDDDDDRIFSTWMSHYKAAEEEKEKEKEKEREMMKNKEADRKYSFDQPVRPRADRRASLPCPAQLSAMQLSRLHSATRAPAPVRAHSRGRIFSNEESGPAKPATAERRPSVIQTIPEVAEVPERKTRFRRRNVMSLSDADRVCLICHDDLHRGGSGIRELHCSHSFHSECIEEWLWRKQACPTCRVQVLMPEPLYWTSAQVKVP